MNQAKLSPDDLARRAASRQFQIFGRLLRLVAKSFSVTAVRTLDRQKFHFFFLALGLRSLPLISFGAFLVSLALTTQVVNEALKFNAQAVPGPALAIGLLRELATLTVSLAWCARTSALLTDYASYHQLFSDEDMGPGLITPAYLACLASSLLLAAYGSVIGFGTAALFAPYLGVTSSADFLESARQMISDKDVTVYFIKMVLVAPLVPILATVLVLLNLKDHPISAVTSAVSYTCLGLFLANLAVTFAWYLQ